MGTAETAELLVTPRFADAAYAAIERIARRQSTVHVDDVLKECSIKPSHPNAWGAVWMKAIRKGLIQRSDRVRPCATDPKKHAHQYPVYESLVWRRS